MSYRIDSAEVIVGDGILGHCTAVSDPAGGWQQATAPGRAGASLAARYNAGLQHLTRELLGAGATEDASRPLQLLCRSFFASSRRIFRDCYEVVRRSSGALPDAADGSTARQRRRAAHTRSVRLLRAMLIVADEIEGETAPYSHQLSGR